VGEIPAVTGKQLIRLLQKDGWVEKGRSTHGIALQKPGHYPTVVPDKKKPIPDGTLGAILGPRQTGIGKKGLAALIEKYGLT